MKYKANKFNVSLIWFTERGVGSRAFKKYKDAVAWAEKYLNTNEIVIRITGTLSAAGNGAGGNDTLTSGNGG